MRKIASQAGPVCGFSALKPRVSKPDLNPMESGGKNRRHALGRWALGLAVAVFAALRIAAVYSAAGNWDEFGLFESASITHETGVLYSGGRPGLAQLVVLPLVADCDDEIEVLQRARLLWVFITLAYLIGVGALVWQLQSERERRLADSLLAVGLLALVPAFLEWSIQVRTDQIALAGGVWGGVALLASKRRPALALAAGVLFGIGFLSSQKLLYLAAPIGLFALAQVDFGRRVRFRREALRAGLCALGFAACILALYQAAPNEIEVAQDHTVLSASVVRNGLSSFDFYRKTIGFSQYRAMLPTLIPHFVLLGALVAATVAGWRRRERSRRALALAWLILALGLAVGSFHAAAFFYFWMTLGLFPALAFAVARRPICDLLPAVGQTRPLAIAGFWLALAGPGILEMVVMLDDTQKVQRESLDFIHSNFQISDAGFHPESALFCRGDAQPLQHYFSADIYRRFGRPDSESNRARLIQQFRNESIVFIVESFRLNQFPVEIRRFWADNYQPYRASVFVAGRKLEGHSGSSSAFELVVSGAYRWLPIAGPQPIELDGQPLGAGEIMHLESGDHVAGFPEDVSGGILILALEEPPGLAPLAFYSAN
jgi:MFS family permease